MNKLCIGWMYPDLLNLHGERGSIQALKKVGQELGLEIEVRRIEDFDEVIPFSELDMLIFLPGEISSFRQLVPALEAQKEALTAYLEAGGYLLALGTSGLMFGKSILRCDGSTQAGLGLLDMTAREREYVWGDDLHLRIDATKQELIGSQIQMADVDAAQPLGQVLYGMGNNNTGAEGARWKNLLYTNCLGPLLVKNPWFAAALLKDIAVKKFLGLGLKRENTVASDSFASTLRFIKTKQ